MSDDLRDPGQFLAALESTPTQHANDEIVPPSERRCPICGSVMELRLQTGVNINACAAHGLWIDNGKFESITATMSVSSARKQRWELEKAQRRGKTKGILFGWLSFFLD